MRVLLGKFTSKLKTGYAQILWSLIGAILLSAFSLIQKRMLGLSDIFAARGFILPVIFGGGSGFLLSWFYIRQNRVADSLRESRERLQNFLDNASDLIQSVDHEGRLTYVNKSWRNALKYDEEDLKSLTIFDIIHPKHQAHCKGVFHKLMSGESHTNIETTFIAKDGSKVMVSGNINCRIEEGVPFSTRGIFRDVTNLRKAQETERLVAKVFECGNEAIVITDPRGRLLKVNTAFTDITGYSSDEVNGRYIHEILYMEGHMPVDHKNAMIDMIGGANWRGEVEAKHRNGNIFSMWLSVSQIMDEDGKISNLIGMFSDITHRKQNELRLKHLATHDSLTGLPNRSYLREKLSEEIARSTLTAVLFIDLDEFKAVNDVYGHDMGDRLMQVVAARIRDSIRVSDFASRLGGDEFAIVAGNLTDLSSVLLIAEKILANVSHPYELDGYLITVTVSIGVSFDPENTNPMSLLKNADLAMYQAKQAGKNTYRVFNHDK